MVRVFAVGAEMYGGNGQREVENVEAGDSQNFGDSLSFGVLAPPYGFDFDISAPNCAPVTPMPSATVEGDFELDLAFADLFLEGRGYASSEYYIGLVESYHLLTIYEYEVGISEKGRNVSLNHSYRIRPRLPKPSPVSVLF
jgi:hypothetical protein